MTVFEPGDTVLSCTPFVTQLLQKHFGLRCNYCYKKCANLMKCSQCLKVMYCSKECQQHCWRDVHKFECKLLANSKFLSQDGKVVGNQFTSTYDQIRYFLRLALKITFDKRAVQKAYPLWDGRVRYFADLVSHEDEAKDRDRKLAPLIDTLRAVINEHCKLNLEFDDLFRLHAILKVNSMIMFDPLDAREYGLALYIDGSGLNHSCKPTTFRWFYGRNLQYRALSQIDTKLEEPTTKYIMVNQPREVRRANLLENWFFKCQCRKCATHEDQEFNYELYNSLIRNQYKTDREYEKLIGLHKILLGDHSEPLTLALGSYLKLVFKAGPTDGNSKLLWLAKVDALLRQYETEFMVSHGPEHPLYAKYQNTVSIINTALAYK